LLFWSYYHVLAVWHYTVQINAKTLFYLDNNNDNNTTYKVYDVTLQYSIAIAKQRFLLLVSNSTHPNLWIVIGIVNQVHKSTHTLITLTKRMHDCAVDIHGQALDCAILFKIRLPHIWVGLHSHHSHRNPPSYILFSVLLGGLMYSIHDRHHTFTLKLSISWWYVILKYWWSHL